MFNKMFKKIIVGLVLVLLVIGVLVLITSKNPIFGIQSFVVLTGSMEPTIPAGSLILTQKSFEYNEQDIITFKQGSVTVTHRIIALKDGGFQTQGDANNASDQAIVPLDKVLGKEVAFLPYLGSFALFLKTLPGFLIFIILPSLIFITMEFWNIKKEYAKHLEKKILEKLEIKND
jgi:signal peptidase I